MSDRDVLTSTQIFDAGLEDFRQLAGPIRARYRTDGFAAGLAFVNCVGEVIAEAADGSNRSPDVSLSDSHVTITLSSHDVGGVTGRDVAVGRRISAVAAEMGLESDTASLMQVEYALDTDSGERVAGFYSALLGAQTSDVHSGGGLVDPTGQVNALWWQVPREDSRFSLPQFASQQRWQPDIWVSHDEVQARIAAALAAGGRLVSDSAAPSYWVLEDPDGNRACICAAMID